MKSVYKITLLVGITFLVSSCHDITKPNYQYMPNMYEAVSYSTYSESPAFKNGKEGQLPVDGTINRGFEPYGYENTVAGYDSAKLNSKSPLDSISPKDKEKAKALFEIYCAICHGVAGNGKGKLATQGKFLGIPSYKDRPTITAGSIYHVVTYGRNLMGSHANQLSQHERWLVADYVLELKSKL